MAPALPEYADEACQTVQREVQALEEQLAQIRVHLEGERRRRGALCEHADHVRVEVQHAQGAVEARQQELSAGRHLLQLARREAAQLRRSAEAERAAQADLDKRALSLDTDCLRAEDALQMQAAKRQWTRQQLAEWAAAEQARVDEGRALEQGRRMEERRIKELMAQLERASLEAARAQQEAAEQAADEQTAGKELEGAAAELRALQGECRELRQRWESVVSAIRHRDAALHYAASERDAATADVEVLQQQEGRLMTAWEAEAAAGSALQQRINAGERSAARLHASFTAAQAAAEEEAEGQALAQLSQNRLTSEIARQTAASMRWRRDAGSAAQALVAASQRRSAVGGATGAAQHELGSAQQRCTALEALLGQQLQRVSDMDKTVDGANQRRFLAEQAVEGAKEQTRQLEAELTGFRAQRRNLKAKLSVLEEQRARQEVQLILAERNVCIVLDTLQEILYNISFQAVTAQRAAARAGGQRTEDEAVALKSQVEALTAALETAAGEAAALRAAAERAEGDHRRAVRRRRQLASEAAAQHAELKRAESAAQQAQRALKATHEAREAKLVQVDLASVRVHHLQALLLSEAQRVAGAEWQREALRQAVAARREELQLQADGLKREVHVLRGDLHARTLDLRDSQAAVEAARATYETLQMKHAPPEGEEACAEDDLLKRASQREEELRQELLATRSAIAAANADCAVLQKAAAEQEASNAAIRQHGKYGGEVHIAEEQAELRAQLEEAQAECACRREEEAGTALRLEQAKSELAAKEQAYATLLSDSTELEKQHAAAQKQAEQQRGRMDRAMQRCKAARAHLEKAGGAAKLPKGALLAQLEADMELGELKAAIDGMLGTLRSNSASRSVPLPSTTAAVPSARAGAAADASRSGRASRRTAAARVEPKALAIDC